MSLPQTLLRALHVYTTEKDLPIRLLQFLLIRESLHVCLLVCVCVCLLSTYPFVIYYLIKVILSYLTYTISGCKLGTQGSAISLK